MLKQSLAFAVLMGCALQAQPDPLSHGLALLKKGDIQHSLVLLREAVRLKPDSAPAHNYYGFALGRNGSLAEAVVEFQKALDIDPQYPEALYNLGAALAIEEQYLDAIEKIESGNRPQAQLPRGSIRTG